MARTVSSGMRKTALPVHQAFLRSLHSLRTLSVNLTGGAARLVIRDRTDELVLLFTVALSVMVLRPILTPDSVIMRLAHPAPSISMPVDPARNALLLSVPADPAGLGGAVDAPAVDIGKFERLQVREYRLVAGDTLSGLAQRNGLRIDTLASFNQISDARRIRVGDVFKIPNRNGIVHTVGRGEALSSIAGRYGTTVNALLDANDLSSSVVSAGQVLFVPDARMSRTDLQRVLGELFVYPVRGRFTSGFGMRNDPFTGIRRFHNGIDLAALTGTAVHAARAGRVVHVENQPGNYGKFVILRHDGGYQTLYAHLDGYSVRVGQNVNQGQQIGTLGNTGRSTGPHLHFSVIQNGSFVDPMRYLQ